MYHWVLCHIMLYPSLWQGDTIWWHSTGPTVTQVMVDCLTAPCQYPNQYWPIIRERDLTAFTGGQFHRNAQDIFPWFQFGNLKSKIVATSLMALQAPIIWCGPNLSAQATYGPLILYRNDGETWQMMICLLGWTTYLLCNPYIRYLMQFSRNDSSLQCHIWKKKSGASFANLD